ncbi:MAG: urease accessory protein UreD [Candidatus Competibacterales bacterium]|nr:urease accessory protein UreD [Candidatus Competibacterales bacterium]
MYLNSRPPHPSDGPVHSPARHGWQAELRLGFERRAGRTRLVRRDHRGPLLVQRPFHPEPGGHCHCYLLHPPGGVVGGDELTVEATGAPEAGAVFTTPAAAKFYRRAGAPALQRQSLRVADGALLEWLPQETLLYAGARLQARTRIELAAEACFIGWELYCLGRPAAGERFTSGSADLHLELWRETTPLLVERHRIEAEGAIRTARWGLAGQPVFATLVCSPHPGAEVLDALRRRLHADGPAASVTTLDGVLLCRYLGPSIATARGLFGAAWNLLRPALAGRPACPPRVWST